MNASPDPAANQAIGRLLGAARVRVAAQAALRATVAGAIAAVVLAVPILLVLGAVPAFYGALSIVATSAATAWYRVRRMSDEVVASIVEARTPVFRNTLVTAAELGARPHRTPRYLADRVRGDAACLAASVSAADLFSLRPLALRAAAAAVPLLLLVSFAWVRPELVELARDRASRGTRSDRPASGALDVSVTVTRPAYTRLPPLVLRNPDRVLAVEGSRLSLAVAGAGGALRIRTDAGLTRGLNKDADGAFRAELPVRTGYLVLEGDTPAERLLVSLVAVPDAAPSVRVDAPGRDLIYPDAARTVSFAVSASDDLELRALRLRYTTVSGSGETFEFTEGEIPLALTRRDARTWDGRATASLASLGLQSGDTLVYRASAADARPDGVGSSDAFVIEIGREAEGLADGFAIGEDQNKYAISQQMVIVKTERLQARRAALPEEAFRSESQAIAAEQRMVRAEFVFMMGGEVEDEEVEAEQSHEVQEGRLENRGQSDLRTAIRLMSDAERRLGAANLAAALPIERAALAALERAFSRNRYILRTIAARNRIDLSRRLSGNRSGAVSSTRAASDAGEGVAIAPVRQVVRGIVELARVEEWTKESARRAADLAERTVMLAASPAAPGSFPVAPGFSPAHAADRPDSAGRPEGRPLHTTSPDIAADAARHLLAASRRAIGTADLARVRLDLQQAVSVLAPIARETAASPAGSPGPLSPALRGAFAEALGRGGPRR